MNSDYTPVAYWQIEIRCNRHADCDLIMQTHEKELKKYSPYWKKVIEVWVDN